MVDDAFLELRGGQHPVVFDRVKVLANEHSVLAFAIEDNHSILIHNNKDTIIYRLSDESIVQKVPSKELKLPSEDVVVELSAGSEGESALLLRVSR